MTNAHHLPRRPVTTMLIVLSGLFLSSCGGGGDAPAGKEPAPAQGPAGSTDATPPSVDACTLVTREEAAAALGQPVGEGVREDMSPVFSCKYDAASKIESLRVSATAFRSAEEAKRAYDAILRTNQYKPVSGIGDRAYIPAIRDLAVHKGRWELDIGLILPGEKEERFEKAKALATTAITRLPN